MWGPGLEEEVTMNEDIAREFEHVKEGYQRVEKHLNEQDRHMSDHFKKFGEHVLDDQQIRYLLDTHLTEHERSAKHRWAATIGLWLAAASTVGILIVEIIKHFAMKG